MYINIAYVDYHTLQKAGQMPTYFDDIVKLTSLGGIRLCCALDQPQTVQKCSTKTILLSQTHMF